MAGGPLLEMLPLSLCFFLLLKSRSNCCMIAITVLYIPSKSLGDTGAAAHRSVDHSSGQSPFQPPHNTEEYHSRHFHDTLTKGFLGHRGKDFYRSRFRFEQSKKKYGNEDMCFEDGCAARFHRIEPLNANVL